MTASEFLQTFQTMGRVGICIADIVKSPEYQQLKAQSKEVARQQRWAKDPMDLMQYFKRCKLLSLRRNLSIFLYELARSIDPDLID